MTTHANLTAPCPGAENKLYQDILSVVKCSAFIFIPLNLYYLLSDLHAGFYSTPHAWPNLIALLLLIGFSAMVLFVSFAPRLRSDNRVIRITVLLFYLALLLSVTIFAYTSNIRARDAGANIEFCGITLSTFYLILIMVAPLPHINDGIILLTVLIATTVFLMIVPGREFFSPIKQLTYRIVIIVGYWYLRNRNKRAAGESQTLTLLNEKLTEYSCTDQLTGARNRHGLQSCISEILRMARGENIGFILFDIDNFKSYNDHYSHNAGDEALKIISSAVTAAFPPEVRNLFRYGGEEFLILVRGSTEERLVSLAEAFRSAVIAAGISRSDIPGTELVTVSLGCAEAVPSGRIDFDNAIAQADTQLYHAKNNGRNCTSFRYHIYR